MGEVYRARDSRLGREVAIKVLPERFVEDEERLQRFEREARSLASLNHPNVAQVFGVDQVDDTCFMVMELVPGVDLSERLARGALPLDEALDVCRQLAEGLEAAHEAGVIHRDLKPANVRVTPDGVAKILDFGLAKSRPEAGSSSAELDSALFTEEGVVLGTPTYMSPEQARARPVDRRTDIWAFGCVLDACLTGQRAFGGGSFSDVAAAILGSEPDEGALPADTPPLVRSLLRRCLVKDPRERLRDAGEARLVLAAVQTGAAGSDGDPWGAGRGRGAHRYRDLEDVRIELMHGDDSPRVGSTSVGRTRGLGAAMVVGLTIAVAGLAAATAWFASRATLPEPERVVRKLEIFAAGPDEMFNASSPRISPDGMNIAFIQGDVVRMRDLSTFEVRTIAEANGVQQVAWSPDGRWLAYATYSALFRSPATGGGTSRLGDLITHFAIAWTDDDQILFSNDITRKHPAIFAMPARGGTPTTFLEASHDEVVDFHAIAAIPGSEVVLYVRHLVDQRTPIEAWNGKRSVVIADFDDLYLSAPVWSPSGHVLFARGFGKLSIWAVPFSSERMEVTGDPFIVQTDASAPSVSADGTLSFVRGSPGLGGELIWILPDGSIESIGDGGELVVGPIVSPDGSRLAFAAGSTPNDMEVWVRDLERGINTRISSLDGFVFLSAWSPDGTEIAAMNFNPANRESGQKTVFLAADGSGPTRDPYPGLLAAFDPDWKRAAMTTDPRGGSAQISAIDLTELTVMGEVTTSNGAFLFLSLSPDGEYILYESSVSGKQQVFCTRFPSGEGRWQVSSDGGSRPHWSPDGATVYYMTKDQELMRVEVTREPSLRFGIPQLVFPAKPDIAEFAIINAAPDGERFVSVRGRDEEAAAAGYKLLLIENWFEEFRDEVRR